MSVNFIELTKALAYLGVCTSLVEKKKRNSTDHNVVELGRIGLKIFMLLNPNQN